VGQLPCKRERGPPSRTHMKLEGKIGRRGKKVRLREARSGKFVSKKNGGATGGETSSKNGPACPSNQLLDGIKRQVKTSQPGRKVSERRASSGKKGEKKKKHGQCACPKIRGKKKTAPRGTPKLTAA